MELARPLDVPPAERHSPLTRIAAGAGLAVVTALSIALVLGIAVHPSPRAPKAAPKLAPPSSVAVDVLDGGADLAHTRTLATRIGSFGYRIGHVTRATRDYPRTQVYYEPGGAALARRLAGQIGCGLPSPLPAGSNPHRLVVIAGSPRATC